jgi:KDO2-lipid IV(A) lauroyltransferase
MQQKKPGFLMRRRKKIKRNLEVVLTHGLTRFARALPRESGFRLFSAIGGAASIVLRRDRDRAVENLAIAFPDMPRSVRQALARAMFKSLGMNAFEFLNLEGSPRERVLGLVERVDGAAHFENAVRSGRGVIAITGHIGCWELLAAYWANRGYTVNVVGRELWEKRLNRELIRVRESLGYHTIDRDSGGREMMRLLHNKGVLAVLIDQHTRVSGVYVPFFSQPAHTPIGAAKMALATGAVVVPMAIYLGGSGRHIIRVLPPIEHAAPSMSRDEAAERMTHQFSHAIEDLIRYDPKQWVWFHRRWRSQENVGMKYAAVH